MTESCARNAGLNARFHRKRAIPRDAYAVWRRKPGLSSARSNLNWFRKRPVNKRYYRPPRLGRQHNPYRILKTLGSLSERGISPRKLGDIQLELTGNRDDKRSRFCIAGIGQLPPHSPESAHVCPPAGRSSPLMLPPTRAVSRPPLFSVRSTFKPSARRMTGTFGSLVLRTISSRAFFPLNSFQPILRRLVGRFLPLSLSDPKCAPRATYFQIDLGSMEGAGR